MPIIQTEALQCYHCGHIWLPRNKDELPSLCPRCKSLRWDKLTPAPNKRK